MVAACHKAATLHPDRPRPWRRTNALKLHETRLQVQGSVADNQELRLHWLFGLLARSNLRGPRAAVRGAHSGRHVALSRRPPNGSPP